MKIRLFVLLAMALLVLGCARPAQQVVPTSNSNIELGLLFENDGCKVFRFKDAGNWHYYTDCRGANSTSTLNGHTNSCGKNCTERVEDEVPTYY